MNLDDGPGVLGSTTLVSLNLSSRPLPQTVPLGSEKPRVTQVTSQVVVKDSHPDPPCSRDSEHRCLAMEGPGSWVRHAVSSSSLAGPLHISQFNPPEKTRPQAETGPCLSHMARAWPVPEGTFSRLTT